MADQPQSQVTALPVATPTQQASHFAMAFNVGEFLLTVGQARSTITPSPTGPAPTVSIEWLVTLAVNAPTMATLATLLQNAVASYESQFGKIPADKNIKITLNAQPPANH